MKKEIRSGIYLLPNLLTTASLFAAFYSLIASMKGQMDTAVIAILIGMIADGLDGRIARLTNTQSEFGAQYDSLSDMVTFGVAPPIILYHLALGQLGKLGWLVAFIYTAAVALRLARFNTQVSKEDQRYFQGLPCPPAAAVMISFAWICVQKEWSSLLISYSISAMTLIIAALMVSNLRYRSFKQMDFKGKVPFFYILLMIVLFVAIAADPAKVLFLGFSAYALSGPILTLLTLHKMRQQRTKKK